MAAGKAEPHFYSQTRSLPNLYSALNMDQLTFQGKIRTCDQLLSPSNRRLLEYWTFLAATGVPERASFSPAAVRDVLPMIWILERTEDDDFRMRLAGTEVDLIAGFSSTGYRLSELSTDFIRNWEPIYRQVLETGAPAMARLGGSGLDQILAEILSLPFRHGSPRPDLVMSIFDIIIGS